MYHDPSTHALEVHVAQLTGKEAGLFLPSGTMSNQIALRSHLKGPPHSVMFDARSHIYAYEAGGTAFHSGAASVAVSPENGKVRVTVNVYCGLKPLGHHITLADIEANVIEGDNVHLFVFASCCSRRRLLSIWPVSGLPRRSSLSRTPYTVRSSRRMKSYRSLSTLGVGTLNCILTARVFGT